MKKDQEITSLKVTEKFDKELIKLLSKDLKMIKAAKKQYITKVNNRTNLLVA